MVLLNSLINDKQSRESLVESRYDRFVISLIGSLDGKATSQVELCKYLMRFLTDFYWFAGYEKFVLEANELFTNLNKVIEVADKMNVAVLLRLLVKIISSSSINSGQLIALKRKFKSNLLSETVQKVLNEDNVIDLGDEKFLMKMNNVQD